MNLQDAFTAGATLFGKRVKRLIVVFEDDERFAGSVPVPTPAGGDEDAIRLTDTQEAIVGVFVNLDPEARPKRTQIAGLLRLKNEEAISKPLAELTKVGVLESKQGVSGFGRGPRFDEAVAGILRAKNRGPPSDKL